MRRKGTSRAPSSAPEGDASPPSPAASAPVPTFASTAWVPPPTLPAVPPPVLALTPPPLARDTFFGRHEALLLFAVITFAAFTRYWRIALPAGIVFDELHFGKFVQWTLSNWYYFDIHPPFAKLTLAGIGWLMGYDETLCDFEPPPGAPRGFAPECEYWKLRSIAAAFSVAACALMYPVARRFGASPAGGALAVLLEVFNIMHNVEGRLVLLNSQLIFWGLATLAAAQRWFVRANAAATGAAPPLTLRERLAWSVGVGVLAGNALSIKHTGLATPALVGVEAALGMFFLIRPLPILDLIVYVTSLASIYTFWFAIHFHRCLISHPVVHPERDTMEHEFMSLRYQAQLINSPRFDPNATWEGFWWTFVTLNTRMVVHSNAITQPHHWGTRPWDWITNRRGVSYWGSTMGTADDGAAVYLFGNPFTTWAVVCAILIIPVLYFLHLRTAWYPHASRPLVDVFRAYYRPIAAPLAFCLSGYAVNLIPYAAVARTCFAYHYMPALVFAHLALALLADRFGGRLGLVAILVGAGGSWLYWSPWIFGLSLSQEAHAARRWGVDWN